MSAILPLDPTGKIEFLAILADRGHRRGNQPFLSPDNRWIGFWADRKLKKLSVEGGIAAELCDARLM